MASASSVISELETAMESGDAERRATTLRRVTDLFLGHGDRLNMAQVELFDDVLTCLINSIESKALAQLSAALATLDTAPPQTIRRLAYDDEITVAGPVLHSSSLLKTSDLVTIASTKGQDHMLAISERATLETAVTDVLVERGNDTVISCLVDNSGASFSDNGFATLAQRAERDQGLLERLGRRVDIPPTVFRQLLKQASSYVRERLLTDVPDERRQFLERLVDKVSMDIGRDSGIGDKREKAEREIRALQQRGELTTASLAAFARAGRFAELSVGLAVLLGVQQGLVDRITEAGRNDAWLVLFKAAGLDLATVIAAAHMPGISGTASKLDVDAIRLEYLRLSVSTARRVLRFWRLRHSGDPAGLDGRPQAIAEA